VDRSPQPSAPRLNVPILFLTRSVGAGILQAALGELQVRPGALLKLSRKGGYLADADAWAKAYRNL
jgi:hypothetical protein